MTTITEEYAILKRMTEKTPAEWMRQNVLLEMIDEAKGIHAGFFKMSDADKDVYIQKEKDESAKQSADYKKYKISPKPISGDKIYDNDCHSFGEE